jgi:hypothetical protein
MRIVGDGVASHTSRCRLTNIDYAIKYTASTYIHTYIHTHIHTYIHTYKLSKIHSSYKGKAEHTLY